MGSGRWASGALGCALLAHVGLVPFACGQIGGDLLLSTPLDDAAMMVPDVDGVAAGDDGSVPPEAGGDAVAQPVLDDALTPRGGDADSSPSTTIDSAVSTTAELDVLLGPWGTVEPPTPIAALASLYNDDDPTVTADLLELYFSSSRNGNTDIHVSMRTAVDAPWGPPVLATGLNTSGTEDTPEIAPDGLTMWFVRSVKGTTTGRDVYVSTRPSRTAAWPSGTLVSELSSPSEDYAPTPSSDGLTMVLSSYRAPSLGGDDLFSSRRPSLASRWTTPTWIPVLESTARESDPFRPGDETLIYFTSMRNGMQIWRSTRIDSVHPWAPPTPVSELTPSGYGAEEPWISSDLRLMYFAIKAPNKTTQISEVRR